MLVSDKILSAGVVLHAYRRYNEESFFASIFPELSSS